MTNYSELAVYTASTIVIFTPSLLAYYKDIKHKHFVTLANIAFGALLLIYIVNKNGFDQDVFFSNYAALCGLGISIVMLMGATILTREK